MPIYYYQHPETEEIVEVVQRMTETHVFSKDGVEYRRVFTVPQGSIDTKINPLDAKEFSSKMGQKRLKLGDFYDASAELSEKRTKIMGKDVIKEKYYEDYSKKRRGRKHPDLYKKPVIEVEF